MSYRLNAVTIHVNSAKEYKREMKEIWRDITNGKLPIFLIANITFNKVFLQFISIAIMRKMISI